MAQSEARPTGDLEVARFRSILSGRLIDHEIFSTVIF